METNPILGENPGSAMLYAGLGVNLTLVTAIMSIPQGNDRYRNPIGEGYLNTLPPLAVDVLVTLAAAMATGVAYNDNHMSQTACGF